MEAHLERALRLFSRVTRFRSDNWRAEREGAGGLGTVQGGYRIEQNIRSNAKLR